MAVGSSIKHVYWMGFTSKEEMVSSSAIIISLFNTAFNSASSILSLTTAAGLFMPSLLCTENESGVSPLLVLGSISYLLGLGMEAVAETQRKFKDDSKNEGKPFTGGLFGMARHINYRAYTIWRSSYALVSGGWIWGGIVAAFFGNDFATRGVPILDEYCTKRYGASWTAYKARTQYKLFPGVY